MIIADTNVVSEFMRDEPAPNVLRWAEKLDRTDLSISVLTVEEIERGIGRLAAGRRRTTLQGRWEQLVTTFYESLVVYDLEAARTTAGIVVHAQAIGRPMSLADAQIAGSCVSRGFALATRNTRDFDHVDGLELSNPFEDGRPG